MGYELHIARKVDWENDEETSSITLEEWLSYVECDKELKLTNGYQMNIPNVNTSWQDSPGFCEWMQHPDAGSGTVPWFDYFRGIISAKYPDGPTVRKMVSIAQSLNAKVQGDDGEFYDENYFDPINEPSKNTNSNFTQAFKKPWWKFW